MYTSAYICISILKINFQLNEPPKKKFYFLLYVFYIFIPSPKFSIQNKHNISLHTYVNFYFYFVYIWKVDEAWIIFNIQKKFRLRREFLFPLPSIEISSVFIWTGVWEREDIFILRRIGKSGGLYPKNKNFTFLEIYLMFRFAIYTGEALSEIFNFVLISFPHSYWYKCLWKKKHQPRKSLNFSIISDKLW